MYIIKWMVGRSLMIRKIADFMVYEDVYSICPTFLYSGPLSLCGHPNDIPYYTVI